MDITEEGERLLQLAMVGSIQSIEALLSKHTGEELTEVVNYANSSGNTPLIIASNYGRYETVKKLLEHGADPSKANKKGVNALFAATKRLERLDMEGKISSAEHSAYSRIVGVLTQHADTEQLKAMARRSTTLASSKIVIFPSVHYDNSEAAELRDWIRQRTNAGERIVAAYELPADKDIQEEFSTLTSQRDLDSVLKHIMPGFMEAQRDLLGVMVAEGVRIYPLDLKSYKLATEYGVVGLFYMPSVISEILGKSNITLEELMAAQIMGNASAYTFNKDRDNAMAHNAMELVEQNAPCTLLVICGAAHAPALNSKLLGSGIPLEFARSSGVRAVRIGEFHYLAYLAGYHAATEFMSNTDEITLLRSLCFMLETNYKATDPKEIKAREVKALDTVEKLHSRDELINFLISRVPTLSLESRSSIGEATKRIRTV